MLIYKDILSGDEMFSDTYKIKLVDNVIYEVYGKTEMRKEGEIILPGANASAEGTDADEGVEEGVTSGVDIVLNHRLVQTYAFDKKGYTSYLKDYMKKILKKLEETAPAEVDVFKTNMNKVMKPIIARFDDFLLYTGETENYEAMVAMMEYRDIDGENVPVMLFFKHGLEEEKF